MLSVDFDPCCLSDKELHDGIEACDEIICKAVALGEYERLAIAEKRLRDRLSKSHVVIARKADKTYIEKIRNTPNLTVEKIDLWLDQWSANFKNFAKDHAEEIIKVNGVGFRAGKTAIYKRTFGAQERAIYQGPPFQDRTPEEEIPIPEVKVEKVELEVTPSFTVADTRAIEQIQKGQLFWVGEYHDEVIQGQIRQVTKDVMLEQGLPRREASKRLEKTIGYLNGYEEDKPVVRIPKGFTGSALQYFDGVAANAATASRIYGSFSAMIEVGAEVYEVMNPLDERTCPVCEAANGSVLDVRKAYEHIVEVTGARSPNAVKDLHPWLSVKDFLKAYPSYKSGPDGTKIFSASAQNKIFKSGIGYPAYHFKCRCSVDVRPESFTQTVDL